MSQAKKKKHKRSSKKRLRAILTPAVTAAVLTVAAAAAYLIYRHIDMSTYDSWVTDADGTRYRDSNGEYLTVQWFYYDGFWYYMDASGYTVSGSDVEIDGELYDFADSGILLAGMVSGTHFINEDRTPITGWYTTDDGTYYLDENGYPVTGITEIDGTSYYFDDNGLLSTGWISYDVEVYVNEDGSVASGWTEIGGELVCLNSDGTLSSGWTETDEGTYYIKTDGTIYTGWLEYGDKTYYLDENGQTVSGLVEIDGETYIFSSDGYILEESEVLAAVDTLDDISEQHQLSKIIDELSSDGTYEVSFLMMDLYTLEGISYNIDTEIYSASTIKGPYVCSIVASDSDNLEYYSSLIQSITYYSDNSAYESLRKTFGGTAFEEWCIAADVDGLFKSTSYYTMYSAKTLAKLWIQNYYYMTLDETGQLLAEYFEDPEVSAIHGALCDDVPDDVPSTAAFADTSDTYTSDSDAASDSTADTTSSSTADDGTADDEEIISLLPAGTVTWSKAGWIGDSSYDSASDCGIVFKDGQNPYLICIMTSRPGDISSLYDLVKYLDRYHTEMYED